MQITDCVKSQNKLANAFCFENHIPKELTSGVVYKFQCRLFNESFYGERVRHLNVRTEEHSRIFSSFSEKKVKPKGQAFENFSAYQGK